MSLMLTNKSALFKRIYEESIFRNENTLTQAYIPTTSFVGRDEELTILIANYKPIYTTKGEFSLNTLVLGGSGVGKSMVLKFFAKQLREEMIRINLDFNIEYLDCTQFRTKNAILKHICEKHILQRGRGYSDNELMIKLLHDLKKNNSYLFIILDEVQSLDQEDIFSLLNSSISFGEANSRFSFVLIARKSDWFSIESEKILSRIQTIITFKPYSKDQILHILQNRIDLAFNTSPFDHAGLQYIISLVDQSKNLRFGIDLIRNCGIYADKNHLMYIDLDTITSISTSLKYSAEFQHIEALKIHELLTLSAILDAVSELKTESIRVHDIYTKYVKICTDLEIKPHNGNSIRRYLRILNNIKLIQSLYLETSKELVGRRIEVHFTTNNLPLLVLHILR